MKRGGIETWLMSVLRHLDRRRFRFDFLVSSTAPSQHEPAIREAGGRILVCMAHSQPLRYAWNFRRLIKREPPYDVIHCHLHHLGGLVVWLAWRAGVPGRVVHSHFDTRNLDVGETRLRRARYRLASGMIQSYATGGLAVSARAAAALYGGNWRSDPRWRLFSLGFEPFRDPVDRDAVRRQLGIPPDALVVGHAGRFVAQKNHRFLVEIAKVLVEVEPRAHFLLIGDGETRAETEARVQAAGLTPRFHFTGTRADAPRLMAGAMDAFLLPSLYEGLPFVLLEAQAAGLPCVFSANVAEEADVLPGLLHRLELSDTSARWASRLVLALSSPHPVTREQALAAIGRTPFNIVNSVRDLENYYTQQADGVRNATLSAAVEFGTPAAGR